jgi:hypothetical protein
MAVSPVHASDAAPSVEPERRWLAKVALGLLVLGICWRLTRYLLQFPIWGDEASLAVNFLGRGFLGLTGELEHLQVAPILFLWLQLAVRWLLGTSELAMRLLPLLAGLGGLWLFWKVCWRTLPPLAAALAVGLLAVSYYPVRHSCEIKPYSFDLLCSLLLLLPAVGWLHDRRTGWLIGLAVLAPFAIAASYPAIFVAAAVTLTLGWSMVRQRDWRAWGWFASANLLILATFAASFLIVGRAQVETRQEVQDFYLNYWEEGFPPADLVGKLQWIVSAHAGEMLAYPIGGQHGASLATLLLVSAGVVTLARERRWPLLALCTLPFGLGVLAALLHRYPYGASARLAQHLAPPVCMLAGLGLARGLEWLASTWPARQRWVAGVAGVLALFGVCCLVRDLIHPTKTNTELWARQLVQDICTRAGDDPIVVVSRPGQVDSVLEWYLKARGRQVHWGPFRPERLAGPPPRIWYLRMDKLDGFIEPLETRLSRGTPAWKLTHHELHHHQPRRWDHPALYCRVLAWEPTETLIDAAAEDH